jgi:RNA:NAD 2'-phosphotransferase (TPT1/KptA family)
MTKPTLTLLVDLLANPKTRYELSWLTVAQIRAQYGVPQSVAQEVQQLSRELVGEIK